MDFGTITKIVLTLLGKREQIVSIILDAIALFKRIQSEMPELTKQLGALTDSSAVVKELAKPPMSIEWLQTSLNKLGAEIAVDGKYGSGTQEAVKKFQSEHGLTADGWAGVQTQAAILDALG